MSKERVAIILTELQRKEWVTTFEATKKLPSNEIPCSRCTLGITATHGNLASKILKYKGVLNLLTNFVCKDCTKAEEDAQPKDPLKKKVVKTKRKLKKGKEPTVLDSIRDETGRYNIPNVNLTGDNKQRYSIDQIASNPILAKEFTNNVCLRPRVYLDNDSTCDMCNLFNNCGCSVKRLSKAKIKTLNNT